MRPINTFSAFTPLAATLPMRLSPEHESRSAIDAGLPSGPPAPGSVRNMARYFATSPAGPAFAGGPARTEDDPSCFTPTDLAHAQLTAAIDDPARSAFDRVQDYLRKPGVTRSDVILLLAQALDSASDTACDEEKGPVLVRASTLQVVQSLAEGNKARAAAIVRYELHPYLRKRPALGRWIAAALLGSLETSTQHTPSVQTSSRAESIMAPIQRIRAQETANPSPALNTDELYLNAIATIMLSDGHAAHDDAQKVFAESLYENAHRSYRHMSPEDAKAASRLLMIATLVEDPLSGVQLGKFIRDKATRRARVQDASTREFSRLVLTEDLEREAIARLRKAVR